MKRSKVTSTTWRQTGSNLWVGQRDGYHTGMIERGRRYNAIDPSGAVLGRYRTLQAAQAALNDTDPTSSGESPPQHASGWLAQVNQADEPEQTSPADSRR